MSYLLRDLPVPDLIVREADQDPIQFTLTAADGTTPFDLTDVATVTLRYRAIRGTLINTTQLLPTTINTPTTSGIVTVLPSTTSFLHAAVEYELFFDVLDTAGKHHTVPQSRPMYLGVEEYF